jgi:hypothetical protein
VNGDGTNPVIDISIPGHTLHVRVLKETSTTLLVHYEGIAYYPEDEPIEDADVVAEWSMTLMCADPGTISGFAVERNVPWDPDSFVFDQTLTDTLTGEIGKDALVIVISDDGNLVVVQEINAAFTMIGGSGECIEVQGSSKKQEDDVEGEWWFYLDSGDIGNHSAAADEGEWSSSRKD